MDHPTATLAHPNRSQTLRWLRFNLVGMLGFLLQTATLWTLVHWSGFPTALSVAIAVFVAVSHNFMWHERFTWRDRPRQERARRWLSFNAASGVLSLITNIGLTLAVIRVTGLPVVASNVIAVMSASLLNFLIADRVVFRG
jgi:putative flippase GtrA